MRLMHLVVLTSFLFLLKKRLAFFYLPFFSSYCLRYEYLLFFGKCVRCES